MIDVLAKYNEVQTRKSKMDGPGYYQRKELKFREWDILTRVCWLLAEAGQDYPKYAIESESPDFLTFSEDKSPSWTIEITEVLRPDYRRGEFWKSDPFKNGPQYFRPEPLNDVWKPLREAICSKSARGYSQNTSLFIYFDISLGSFSDWETSFEEQLLNEHLAKPFERVDCFGGVFVLSSDMKRLVKIHPASGAIVGTARPL